MSAARLTSTLLVGSISRLAARDGGFVAVLAKGDPTSGSMILQLLEKGQFRGLFERFPDPKGVQRWQVTGPQTIVNTQEIEEFLARRRRVDPDLWVIELDIPDAERFVADLPNVT